MSSTVFPGSREMAAVSADPDAGQCDSGRPNLAGYDWGQPYVCPCGSVGSMPCRCERSTSTTAVAA